MTVLARAAGAAFRTMSEGGRAAGRTGGSFVPEPLESGSTIV